MRRIEQIEEYFCTEETRESMPDSNRLGSLNLLTGEVKTSLIDRYGNHYAIDVFGCYDLKFLITFSLWNYKTNKYLNEVLYGE